ncbi:MAG: hypothetical protein MUF72_17455 [Elainella sp. Prado103]|jgi:nickel transport protein|nr:hypothetical protein [Elainella sp. Prado103]
MVKTLLFSMTVLLSCWLLPAPAFAHTVQTDYQLVADGLQVQSTFSTGEAFQGAIVKVFAPNQSDQPWLEGTTDVDGKFSFQPDQAIAGEWSVEIGEGDHGDILSVPVNAQGVDVEAISQAPDLPHVHSDLVATTHTPKPAMTSQGGKQMIVWGAVLGGVGTSWWMRRRRR